MFQGHFCKKKSVGKKGENKGKKEEKKSLKKGKKRNTCLMMYLIWLTKHLKVSLLNLIEKQERKNPTLFPFYNLSWKSQKKYKIKKE